ncbi:MAG: tRNA1(Val) (adenine(37)-N6)-methyltransferase [Syntrophomonadaceae bacterium]|jgi:tRNA1Val (adenine37-N6)-methyltransferase
MISPDETLDDLIIGGLKLIQPHEGYRFSLDSVLLAHFAVKKRVKLAVDLGSGNGIIPLIMAWRSPELEIIGIEIQEQMVERAQRSVLYNGLQQRISIIKGDIRNIKEYLSPGSVELVVSNPPYWCKGQGLISHNHEEAIARHELMVNLAELIQAAAYLLPLKGSFCLIHRADRLNEITKLCNANGIIPVRLRTVHSFPGQEAQLILLEAQKGERGSLKILAPLIIYSKPGKYSDEINNLYYGKGR